MSQSTAHARFAPRPATRRPLTPLRVVPTAIQHSGNGVFAGICMGLLGLGLVVLLMLNTALAQGSFRLKDLHAQSGQLTDTQEQLTQAIDDLRSPRTLAARAQEMGMVPAKSMAFVRLSDGAVIGVAQPAKAEQRLNVVTTPAAAPPAPPPPAPAAPAAPAAPSAPAVPAAPQAQPAPPPQPAQPAQPATTATR